MTPIPDLDMRYEDAEKIMRALDAGGLTDFY
jgi:hypothetical protein